MIQLCSELALLTEPVDENGKAEKEFNFRGDALPLNVSIFDTPTMFVFENKFDLTRLDKMLVDRFSE